MRRNPRRERPERAASPQPRATPWVSTHKHLRPVRAKVWANGWLLLLPLQGVGNRDMVPRALPWAMNLLGFQPAQGRLYRRERPERAASSQPRATPWVSVHKSLRPVRAKVWANGWLLLLPLQGVGIGEHGTQGVALGYGLVGLSARERPQIGFHASSPST